MLHLSPRCCLAYKRRTDLYEQTQTVVESLLSNLAGEFAQVCSRLLIIRDHGPADLPLDKREAKDEEDERYWRECLLLCGSYRPLDSLRCWSINSGIAPYHILLVVE
jgi:hypothetical protein